ncbi:hypothetical protein QFC20_002579 [Naganishia adeliensis]|uniref:Uncharacterized protein n=1 Tax=Naganishia adeliensis TaxID=92952 RepID=A0ACC2WIR0_9TREE|nr:hypothetical protein QFC20_002579 [Naganishia adeliensis]
MRRFRAQDIDLQSHDNLLLGGSRGGVSWQWESRIANGTGDPAIALPGTPDVLSTSSAPSFDLCSVETVEMGHHFPISPIHTSHPERL